MERTTTRRRLAMAIWAVACVLALLPSAAAAQTPEPTTLPYTHDCGGELEKACLAGSDFWGATPFGDGGNGNFGCDRGLIEGAGGRCYNRTRYSAALDGYAGSWEEWAHDNQRRQLAAGEPLNWVISLAAHNGYNNRADGYNTDPNQNYSLTDQLRGSVRWLDLDLHKPPFFGPNIRLCHAGCGVSDRFYDSAMKEIGSWLNAHPKQVILISLEDKVGQEDPTADDRINNPIQLHLDQNPNVAGAHRVYKPGDARTVCPVTCAGGRWPSQRELLAAGKQVIIFSDISRGGKYLWHGSSAEDPGYSEAADQGAQAMKFDFDACTLKGKTEHRWRADATRWGVVTEDRTHFGAVYKYAGLIDNLRAAKAALCNVTKISLDQARASETTDWSACNGGRDKEQLTDPCPNPDRRIFNTIWSWADGDRGQYGDRALLGGIGKRWLSANGTSVHRFACAKPRSAEPATWRGADWAITHAAGPWSDGFRACAAEFPGFVFSVPVNGWQNKQLLARLGTSQVSVWLNYLRPGPVGTDWTVRWHPTTTTVSPPRDAVYTGKAQGATAKVSGEGGAVLPDAAAIVTYTGRTTTTYGPTATPPTAAGDYTATASYPGGGEYLPSSGAADYTIGKKNLTVTAADKMRLVNTGNPPLTGSLTGVIDGDGMTVRFHTDAVPSSPPGSYPIYPELVDPNAKLANYDVTKTNGTMRVVVPITITAPTDGQVIELGSTVLARYTCSPLVTVCLGPVPPGLAIDTTTVGDKTFTVTAFHNGFPLTASVRYTVRDTAPEVSIRTPAEGATYAVGQGVRAAYSCADPALVSCVGTVANGASLNTASLGAKRLRVTAVDATGNRATVTHRYRVVATPGGGVAATSGDGQVAAGGAAFANPLVATVTSGSGRRLPGAPVVFIANGPATFPGGATSVSVTTNARGVATSPPLTAGALPAPIPSLPVAVTASSTAVTGVSTVAYQLTVTRP